MNKNKIIGIMIWVSIIPCFAGIFTIITALRDILINLNTFLFFLLFISGMIIMVAIASFMIIMGIYFREKEK